MKARRFSYISFSLECLARMEAKNQNVCSLVLLKISRKLFKAFTAHTVIKNLELKHVMTNERDHPLNPSCTNNFLLVSPPTLAKCFRFSFACKLRVFVILLKSFSL